MNAREPRLADVAHELRSPLNAIRTWAHVLESQLPNATPEVRRALEGIRLAIEQQVGVIESLEGAARRGPAP